MGIWDLAGLVGVTLVITSGGWLDPLREWLAGFSVPANPLRVLGSVLSSTLATGMVVGACGAALRGSPEPLLCGGTVALLAAVADEALALAHAVVVRLMPTSMAMPPLPLPRVARKPGPLTEDEAHAMMDGRQAEDE